MKKIVFTRADGGLSIVHPNEGARLASRLILEDGTVLKPAAGAAAQRVEDFLRRWPVDGATVTWAETGDAFIARIRDKDVPLDALEVAIVDEDALPDRSTRAAWKLVNGAVVVDTVAAQRASLLAALAALDAACSYNRGLREVILAVGAVTKILNANGAGLKDAVGSPVMVPDTTGNVGMVKVQDIENQAKALRAQLAALA